MNVGLDRRLHRRYERRLSEEMDGVRVQMAQVEASLRTEIAQMGASIRQDMAQMGAGSVWMTLVAALAVVLQREVTSPFSTITMPPKAPCLR